MFRGAELSGLNVRLFTTDRCPSNVKHFDASPLTYLMAKVA